MRAFRSILLVGFCAPIGASLASAQTALLSPIPTSPYSVRLQPFASNFYEPTDLQFLPGSPNTALIADGPGIIYNYQNGVRQPTPFLDITSTDHTSPGLYGLASMAFDPGFNNPASTGYHTLYTVSTEATGTAPADYGFGTDHQDVIYQWKVNSANTSVVDTSTRKQILRIDKPGTDHNTDQVVFGPDGDLYIGIGDGANLTFEHSIAQDTSSIMAKILRIDVEHPGTNGRYSIPPTNPFANSTGPQIKETYAYGFRNPYRMSFDPATNNLYVGDVGQRNIEEVDKVVLGGNYGWDKKEGTFLFNEADESASPDDGDAVGIANNFIEPIAEYDHTQGVAVMGGFVYHGTLLPQLDGKYIFGDFHGSYEDLSISHGRLFDLDLTTGHLEALQFDPAGSPPAFDIEGFGENPDGEIYVLTHAGFSFTDGTAGAVFEIVPEPASISMLLGVGAISFCTRRKRR